MVARISVPSSIRRALTYNEQKVLAGKAECLLASGFLQDANGLTFSEKLARFNGLISLNGRAKTNTVHISLNFPESEILPTETLREIAAAYMEKIGFSEQPFLVYEHRDAGHPHLHIVTTNIRFDGHRISLHNLGRGASDSARKALEVAFGLRRAGEPKKSPALGEKHSPSAKKVTYGKHPTRQAVETVLNAVLPHYRYASLPELNAVLRRYNVLADRGAEGSHLYRTGGLVYRVLDDAGAKVGVPLNASTVAGKPTLAYLQRKFNENAFRKEAHKKSVQTAIDWVMVHPPRSLPALATALQNEGITLVLRQNEQGVVYGLTYIDERSKCVFNGSDLGKAYSAKGVLERCDLSHVHEPAKQLAAAPTRALAATPSARQKKHENNVAAPFVLEALLRPETSPADLPAQPKRQKKKRRKH